MTNETEEDLLDYKNSYTEGQEIISNLKADLEAERELAERLSIEVAELGKKVYDSNQGRDHAEEQLGLWKENFCSVAAARDTIAKQLNACRAKLNLAEARVSRLESVPHSLSDEAAYAIIHGDRPEMGVRQELYDHGWIEDPDADVMVWTEKGMWPLKKGEGNDG